MLFNLVLDIKVAINSHYLSFGELAPETENKQIHRYFKKNIWKGERELDEKLVLTALISVRTVHENRTLYLSYVYIQIK